MTVITQRYFGGLTILTLQQEEGRTVVLFWQGVGADHEGNETNNLVHDTWLRAGGGLYMYSARRGAAPARQ